MLNEKVESLIKLIGFKENLTEEQIAARMKLNKAYISQQRSRGAFTVSFLKKLQMEFGDVIKNQPAIGVSQEIKEGVILTIAAKQQVQSRYLAEIYAKIHLMSVTGVLSEMERLEKESVEHLLKTLR